MRLLVCGGRHFSDEKWLGAHLDAIHREHPDLTIGCGYDPSDKRHQGADQLAYEWAKAHGVHGSVYPAHWDDLGAPGARVVTPKYKGGRPYNAAAGPQRNQRMLDTFKPDRGLAAPGDAGTADMCRRLRKAGVPVDEMRAEAVSDDARCVYDEGWYRGRCVRPSELGDKCLRHAHEVCDGCGAPATHNCSGFMGEWSCAYPLCDNCEAVNNHEGGIFPMRARHGPKVCVEVPAE